MRQKTLDEYPNIKPVVDALYDKLYKNRSDKKDIWRVTIESSSGSRIVWYAYKRPIKREIMEIASALATLYQLKDVTKVEVDKMEVDIVIREKR